MEPVEPAVKPSPSDTPAAPAAKPSLKERFKTLLMEYGPLAFAIHWILFGLSMAGFYIAIKLGFQVKAEDSTMGIWGAAYVGTQIIKIPRLALVLVLTPLLGRIPFVTRLLHRFWTPPAAS